jgi:hypothetical protein
MAAGFPPDDPAAAAATTAAAEAVAMGALAQRLWAVG